MGSTVTILFIFGCLEWICRPQAGGFWLETSVILRVTEDGSALVRGEGKGGLTQLGCIW